MTKALTPKSHQTLKHIRLGGLCILPNDEIPTALPHNREISGLTGNGYFLAKKIGKAVNEYEMIKNEDRVLVGVSGGKDKSYPPYNPPRTKKMGSDKL